ncbi:hypothetical protein KKD52_06625 [Myxococcota bacterium]|nr:hypothetical protein [Myxococcota bacterium]MBU1510018.1 hypothetical protein [Myxococcota bacterium]
MTISLPHAGFAARIFLEECIASAQPLSEPGRALAHSFRAFGPGEETGLAGFWDRTEAVILLLRDNPSPLLEPHLKNCNGLWFLQEDPASWGPVELARLESVAQSARWLRDEIVTRLPAEACPSGGNSPLLELLSPHCARGGFRLAAEAGSGVALAREDLRLATDRWQELDRALREQVAGRLGTTAGRLRSDLTVAIDDEPKLRLCREIEELAEIAILPHQVQFRFMPTGEAREAHAGMTRLRQRCHQLETDAIAGLCARLAPFLSRLNEELDMVGRIDLLRGRARWAIQHDAVRPRLSLDGSMTAIKAHHPVIRSQVESLERRYQPLTFTLRPPLVSLTGANMGGKTAFLRTVGLLQALFQLGYFIPSSDFAARPVRSMAWVGAVPDSPTLGLSSFGRECRDLLEALHQDLPQLMLVDEFARSTDAEEGLALTGALLDHLGEAGEGLFVFAGHQKRLTCHVEGEIQYLHTGGLDFTAYLRNLGLMEAIPALAASMNYQILDGCTISSDALQIALALGVPENLVRRAREILSENASGMELSD